MYRISFFVCALLHIPVVGSAQAANTITIDSFGNDFISFISDVLLPLLFAIALVIFMWQMVRYFIIDIENSEYRERARNYAIYSIIAFVLMVSIWGIVNLLLSGTGLGREEIVCPDTLPEGYCEGGFTGSGSGGGNNYFGGDDSSDGSGGGNWSNLWERFGEIGDKYFPGGSDASTDDDTDSSGDSASDEADDSSSADAGSDEGTQDSTIDSVDGEAGDSNTESETATTGGDTTTEPGVDGGSSGSDTSGGDNADGSETIDTDDNSNTEASGNASNDPGQEETATESYVCQYPQRQNGTYDRSACLRGCNLLNGSFVEQADNRAICTYTPDENAQ